MSEHDWAVSGRMVDMRDSDQVYVGTGTAPVRAGHLTADVMALGGVNWLGYILHS